MGGSSGWVQPTCRPSAGRNSIGPDTAVTCPRSLLQASTTSVRFPWWAGTTTGTGWRLRRRVSKTNRVNTIAGWTDYWQQFRDMIDIAYNEYGLRTQLTIFADAQLMPGRECHRIEHMQRVLDNLQGREHKVILLEVANEAWQNGFPGAGGTAQVRQFGRYLADRTEIPVALTSPSDTSNAGIEALYQGQCSRYRDGPL